MIERRTLSRKVFLYANYIFLTLFSITCLFPIIHMAALSFSSNAAVSAGWVTIWPVDFNLDSYKYIFSNNIFMSTVLVSFQRVILGVSLSLTLTVLAAYPLSKSNLKFRSRTIYSWFFVITMIFNGGLIPTFMVVKETGLMDTIWALVIPSAVNVFNIVLMLNFFRTQPPELEESAQMDGAGSWRTLWSIYLPISKPSLATIALFSIIFHWNSWFDGMIYMNSPSNYPLQTYLRTVIVSRDLTNMNASDLSLLANISNRTVMAAQLFVSMLPVLCIYPFLQKYFVKGIVLGSVKG
ncbi:putative aldouronate transport system permease protein [Paenibacillus amylolyticus]|uniref:Aldouronate transport system permease protein n=1 Tax=Paenibacillus amylolyticus TaxID=1451 RepID=A0AAP5H3A5_PAEAM|nr:carbohydrate ABC transporter permease [Paenibacillus amylolyticus]MDR6724495.1 putative aldouronate transport system permease protein [Paenibacillus amylolyticus]